ncbi:MAG: hypothetical protein ABEJ62_02410 [Candidatus Nanohaloarchaea archaeon]
MFCGAVLRGEGEESAVAFLDGDGNCTTRSVEGNEEIVEMMEEKRPDVVAMNAPLERSVGEGPVKPREKDPESDVPEGSFREGEEELVEEGYSVLPRDMRDRDVLEQGEHLSRSVEASGIGALVIESDPRLVAEELGVGGDEKLEAYGVDTSDIGNVWEFDAAVLALLARFHSEGRTEENDLVLPDTEEV